MGGDCVKRGVTFEGQQDACLEHLKNRGVDVTPEEVAGALESEKIVSSYNSFGGTGPEAMRGCLDRQAEALKKAQDALQADMNKHDTAYEACRSICSEVGSVSSLSDFQKLVQKHKPASL